MKLLKITSAYPAYIRSFYANRLELTGKSFAEQQQTMDFDSFGWADFWSHALSAYGYETMEITVNAEPMQRAWAREHHVPDPGNVDLRAIVVAQARLFKPDILWFEDSDDALLKQIRAELPCLKLVLGWVGSAIPMTPVLNNVDIILTCAPESLAYLRKAGHMAAHLNHGFDPRIIDRLNGREQRTDVTFIGQLVRRNTFHLEREKILEDLSSKVSIQIYSPSASMSKVDYFKAFVAQGALGGMHVLKQIGIKEAALARLPIVGKMALWTGSPKFPINLNLRPFVRPGIFGLEMYQAIKESRTVLNIHADSSPEYASNMRLFEVTGVGSCLITDWKKNIADFFEPDVEIITYKCAAECVEKIRWLIEHPVECAEIARAGQKRTLREHTYHARAEQFDDIIRNRLRYS